MSERRDDECNLGNELLQTAIWTAVLIGAPIAVGWLSEKLQQSGTEGVSAARLRHGRAVRAGEDAMRIAPAVSRVLYKHAVRDITAQDRRGELPQVLWRSREIDQLATLLGGSRPESVLLVGETGIGKTALVECLAQSINAGQAPELRRYAILSFRPGCLDGTAQRAQAGAEAAAFMDALSEARDHVIAFFDDFQAFVELGDRYSPHRRAIHRLQQAMTEGRFRSIAAISMDDYRRSIASDPQWKRCFTEIRLERRSDPNAAFGELDVEKTYAIVERRAREYPARYELEVKPQAIEEAIRLAERRLPVEQLPTKRLPGKALLLLEETAKRLRPRWDAPPIELTKIKEEIEALQARRGRSGAQRNRAQEIEACIAALKKERQDLIDAWTELKDAREDLGQQVIRTGWLHQAVESAALNQAGKLTARYREELRDVQTRRHQTEERLEPLLAKFAGLTESLDAADVKRIFSDLTGIPVAEVGRDEQELLMTLERRLHRRVVGQERAVAAVAKALRRARAGVGDEGRPIGNFMFLGPSGVGKTELAKALTEALFGDENAMKRMDMGEYYDRHCVARLIGAPPGYVGYEGGGELTEAVRRRPHSVILFDEIEKANSRVFDTLLQVLDDGRLTDGLGRMVSFKDTIIIMTSNVGSRTILEQGAEDAKDAVFRELQSRSGFRPEFLNRMDAIIFFDALTRDELRRILDLALEELRRRVKDRHGIHLRLTDGAKDVVIERGHDPASGARQLKRTLRDLVADRLAPEIIGQTVRPGDTLTFDHDGDGIVVRHPRVETAQKADNTEVDSV